jgi:hypothetical protein
MFLKLNRDSLLSLIVGFIDGDGSITFQHGRTDSFLRIKNHNSWLHILKLFADVIMEETLINFPTPKTNNQGYASLACSNLKILQFLKNHAIKYKLPILERKWDKIDMVRISAYEIADNRREQVRELFQKGFGYKQISKEVGISMSRISNIINKEL